MDEIRMQKFLEFVIFSWNRFSNSVASLLYLLILWMMDGLFFELRRLWIIYTVEEKIVEIEQYVEYFGYRCTQITF